MSSVSTLVFGNQHWQPQFNANSLSSLTLLIGAIITPLGVLLFAFTSLGLIPMICLVTFGGGVLLSSTIFKIALYFKAKKPPEQVLGLVLQNRAESVRASVVEKEDTSSTQVSQKVKYPYLQPQSASTHVDPKVKTELQYPDLQPQPSSAPINPMIQVIEVAQYSDFLLAPAPSSEQKGANSTAPISQYSALLKV